jgi:predicted lipoprotein with Yx(FWY)xxD motif
MLGVVLATVVVLSGCGGGGSGSASPSPASPFGLADSAALGKVLVATNGNTLYIFKKDTDNTSACYDACAATWPPYIVTSAMTGMAGKIATAARRDGALQLTYNKQPLYFYSKDAKPGDTTGQGVGGIWFVVQNP